MLSCFSCALLFAMLWNIAHQSPLPMGFTKQEYWSGLNALLQNFLTQGSNPFRWCLLHWQVGSLSPGPPGKPKRECVLVAQSCPTLFNSMAYRPPGSSVHGILQARILEWVAIPFSRESFQPRNLTQVSCISCTAGKFFYCLSH